MLPTAENYAQGNHEWTGTYKGLSWLICHWGISSYQPSGIWNFYIHIAEWKNPELFARFLCTRSVTRWLDSGPYRESYDYEKLDIEGFPGGITFYDILPVVDPQTGKDARIIKIGCDYNHLWDEERGHPETFESIKRDVEVCVDSIMAPQLVTSGLV